MRRPPPHTVFVNGTPREVLPRLYFDQIVRSAFGGVYVEANGYTVTYDGAKAGRGKLRYGDSIKTEDGMRFEVTTLVESA